MNVEKNTPQDHVFNNLLLGSCSGLLTETGAAPLCYIIHKNNGMYKCKEKC